MVPTTIKEAVQAIDEYLAVSGSEQTLRAMPVEPAVLPTQPSALEVSLKAMAEEVTQQTNASTAGVGENWTACYQTAKGLF